MPDNEINIVVTATDKASAALKGVRGSIITLNQGLELAQKAFKMVSDVVQESIGAYVKYADQVRRLSQLNGTNAQETSRIIQLTDDHKVSVEALTMATRKLSQQGLSLTIDSLSKMSDEYLQLGSSSEKTRFLLDKFGRSGLQFAETMEQGGAAIRGQSAAISQNLILTQKQLVAARDYEKQLDELNDTVMGFKVALGASLLPVLLDVTQTVKDAAPAWMDWRRQAGIIADFLVQSGNPALLAFGRYLEWIQGLIGGGKTDIDSATRSYIAMASAIDSVGNSAEAVDDVIRGLSDAEQSFLLSTQEMTPKAVAEFVKLQEKIAQVKRMIAEGASFNVIVNFLAGRTIMVDPNIGIAPGQNPGAPAKVVTPPKNKRAGGGSIPMGGMAWVGDTLAGGMAHAELVYAPQGAYVFNSAQSRGSSAPKAAMGGIIPPMGGEMSLSSSTIRQLASAIAGEISRNNG